ncbi:hypothetical protein M5K25_018852 [Dendrobium thyrsiflorum]|uniref:Omega-hydroxypalmitate O-feruloyl transferase n=1 Tax=Dendrobium thyrsiflorum TaxID=117978 RepID=A0ABD0UK56_DENTH
MINISCSTPVMIKPAEETPTGDYFLSNLDLNLPIIIKTLDCFPTTARRSFSGDGYGDGKDVVNVLRTSLQKVLVHFYPFIGRLAVGGDGKLFVKFNGDDGVPFVEATADCELENLGDISIPDPEKLRKFVYCPEPLQKILDVPLLTVQATKFRCGGLSIGLVMNHLIVDGVSIIQFRQAWAETARGLSLSLPPFLDRSILRASLPLDPKLNSHSEQDNDLTRYISPEKLLCRRFLFDAAKLSRLKQLAAAADDSEKHVSNFASLAAFVWSARTKALNIPSLEPSKLLFAVDVRNRLQPPLPPGFFGNGIVFAGCSCPAESLTNRPLNHAIQMVMEAARGVTNQFVRSIIADYEITRSRPSMAGAFMITSWTQLEAAGLADFGWGEPAQFGPAEIVNRELAIVRPYNKDGKGISMILALPAPAMHSFKEMMDF